MCGHVTVASGDTEDEGIIGGDDFGGNDRIVRLFGGVHLGEDFLRERLSNPM